MRLPCFSAEFSLHGSNGHYDLPRSFSRDGRAVKAAREVVKKGPPLDICALFPHLCQPVPAINVSWLTCNNGSGYVVVTGTNFAAQTGVQVEVGNCSEGFSVPVGATTDVNGAFATWVPCGCGGSTTVIAIDSTGNWAQGSAPMPC